MKLLPLSTKISIISVVFIVVSIVFLGFYFDTFLKKNYFNNSKGRIAYAKNRVFSDFIKTENELTKGIDFLKTDIAFGASVELINNYQDKQDYNFFLLDEEKKDIAKKLLDKVKVSFNSGIALYDKNEELISFIDLDSRGYKLNFISYENLKPILYSRYEDEKVYKKSVYIEDSTTPFRHISYYTQTELERGAIITHHYSNDVLFIKSHQSIFDKYDKTQTMAHIEMSKAFDKLYFKNISNNLNIDVFLSDSKKYEKISTPFLSSNQIKDENIKEDELNYFSSFSIEIGSENIFVVFSLDKSALKGYLDENRKQLVIFLILCVVFILIIFRMLVQHGLSRPLDKLMNQIDKVKSGDYSDGEILKTSDEFEVISENINKLTRAVESREKKLEYLSSHDELTGLLNRRRLSNMLDEAIERVKKNGTHLAVLFLDLDQFKQVNDTLGHSVGDNLLKAVSNRLRSSLRDGDVLARVGGDEFNIFVEGFRNIGELHTIAQKILDEFQEPFVDSENEIITSTSIGISLYPEDGSDSETLIKNADLAMYMSKDRGRNSYSFYAPEFSVTLQKRTEIVHALKSAIKNQNEFILYYQPKVSIKTKKIIGVEALIRWKNPLLGFVRPDEFISVAEDTHLIIDIGKWVINKACKDFAMLKNSGYKLEQISVNISGVELQYSDMIKTVKDALYASGISAKELELEVTESYIATNEQRAVETLARFREMGIELAIDDFGTGYSSMSYLQKLPITRLKIDKAFVDELPESHESVAVVQAIMALAKTFKLKITVEGVEYQKQLEFFSDKYCDEVQGYIYSKPLPIEDLKEFISNNS